MGWCRPKAAGVDRPVRPPARAVATPSRNRRPSRRPPGPNFANHPSHRTAPPSRARHEPPASSGGVRPALWRPAPITRTQRPRAQPERGMNNNVITSPPRVSESPECGYRGGRLFVLSPRRLRPQSARSYPLARRAPARCPHRSRTARSSARSGRRLGRTPSPGPRRHRRRRRSSRRADRPPVRPSLGFAEEEATAPLARAAGSAPTLGRPRRAHGRAAAAAGLLQDAGTGEAARARAGGRGRGAEGECPRGRPARAQRLAPAGRRERAWGSVGARPGAHRSVRRDRAPASGDTEAAPTGRSEREPRAGFCLPERMSPNPT